MRVKVEIDLNQFDANAYATIPAEADEVHLTWPDVDLEYNTSQKIYNALSALPPQITKVDLTGNFLGWLDADLGQAFYTPPEPELNRTFTSIGLGQTQLFGIDAQDFRRTLVALNVAGVSSVDLSRNDLFRFSANELGEVLSDLSAITSWNLSGNNIRTQLGLNGLTTILANLSAHSVRLDSTDLDLNDDELSNLIKNMSPTINEILCDSENIQNRINLIFSAIREPAVESIMEGIPGFPKDLCVEVMQYATHQSWKPNPAVERIMEGIPNFPKDLCEEVMQYATQRFWKSSPKVSTNNTITEENPETPDESVDTSMTLR